jgi:hypothetical protein
MSYCARKQRKAGELGSENLTGLLEFSSVEPGLPDDGLQGANPDCIVVWNRHGDCARRQFLLHDKVASVATHFLETMICQN